MRPQSILILLANTFAMDTRVRREARALATNGFDVQILCWDRQGRRPAAEIMDECQVRNVKFGRTTALVCSKLYYLIAALFFQAAIFVWAVKQISEHRAIFLHANDFNTLLPCAAIRRFFGNQARLVYDCHELTPGAYREWYGTFVSAVVGRLELAALPQVDAIMTANEAIRAYLAQESTAPAAAIYCCPSIHEIPAIHQREAKKRLELSPFFVTLFSGRARQDYDLDMMLDAARDLRRTGIMGFRFVFTGPPDTISSLLSLTIDEGLQNFFDFRGWVTREELFFYYIASDLCFAVTRDVGANTKILTPIKLFESMACGVPVLVRKGTLASGIIENWGCGVVVQEQTRLSAELIRLRENPQMLRGLGAASRKAFLAEYNWDRMQVRLLDLYANLPSLPTRKNPTAPGTVSQDTSIRCSY
jgi:glycosyltransferase involved in cell wall biosynthesis